MDCSPPGSSIYGIFWARVLEWGAIAFSRKTDSAPFLKACSTELGVFTAGRGCGWGLGVHGWTWVCRKVQGMVRKRGLDLYLRFN